ncbi:MAG: O-antigen ligase family protein [Gammaproteobacteria bacterium]|nr:O-antigen ligase family protein [Gammaproteobacteria bacterium]
MATGGWLQSYNLSSFSRARATQALWPFARSPVVNAITLAAVAVLVALFAVVTTTFAFTDMKFVVGLILGLIGALGVLLSGNRRLFVLYAVVMFAPLKLGKNFMPIGHQGGSGSFLLDAGAPFVLMLAAYQFNDWRKARLQGYRVPLLAKLWLFMIALGLVTLATGPFKTPAAHEMVRMSKYLILLLVLINELKRRKQFLHVAFALLLGVLIQSVFSVASYASGSQFGLEFVGEETEKNVEELGQATLKGDFVIRRPGGLMGHPNQFAGYLALIMPLGVALLFSPIGMLLKGLFVCILIAGQVGLLLTLSRSGWICFAAALVGTLTLGFLHRSSRRRFLIARAVVISLIGVVGLAASPKIIERIQYSDPESWRSRMEFVETAKRIILDKPIFGLGLNSYVFAQPPYTRFRTYEGMTGFYGENVPVVHSTWLLTWAEQGTVGMAVFVLIHLQVLFVGLNNLKLKDGFLHAMNVGLLSGFGAVMLDGLVSFFVRMEVGGRMFWFVVALILAIGYWRRTHESSAARAAHACVARDDPGCFARVWMVTRSPATDTRRGWLGQ